MTVILYIIAICLLMLVTGVFFGMWLAISRSYHLFSVDELNRIAKVIIKNLAVPMRFLSMGCLLFVALSAFYYPDKNSFFFYLIIISFISTLSALLITVLIEVPINNQIITWTSENAPANWEEIRNRWQFYNVVRTIAALIGFILFVIASVIKI
jgi:uncharacterized membrane protein